jgi:hypothetical protein
MPASHFSYDIEFTPEANPPGTTDTFREALREWIVARHLGYTIGALGGGRHCYGHVGSSTPVTEADRQDMAAWVSRQRICAKARFGSLNDLEPTLLDPITDLVFAVDNLTEADRIAAAEYHFQLKRKIQDWAAKRRG